MAAAIAKEALQAIKKGITTPTPTLQLTFAPESRLKLVQPSDSSDEFIPIYSNGCNVSGHLDITMPNGAGSIQFAEIAVYLVGHVLCSEIDQDSVFVSSKLTLKTKGWIKQNMEFDFKFTKPPLINDSFYGTLFKCRYFIRAIINRSQIFLSNYKTDSDFMVMNLKEPGPSKAVTMQVGVEDALHIQFHYDNINLSNHGCLKGNVKILANSLKIHTMQIQLICREVIRTGTLHKPEVISTNVIGKFEIMDGAPGDGETIPIRLFLNRFKNVGITQTTDNFSVKYYVNLGLLDKDGRRYFKTCELQLFRTKLMM